MLNEQQVKVGIAPINWSNDDLPELGSHVSFEQCITEMEQAGYVGCEVGVKFPRDPQVLKPLLEAKGLRVCNQWANYKFSTESFATVKKDIVELLQFLHAMGADIIGGGEVGTSIQGNMNTSLYDDKPYNSPEQWKALTQGLNELGKIAKEEFGIKLCFHHHMGTCVQTIEEVEMLLHDTKPEFVSLNYDCGHFYASDEDPAFAAKKFATRIGHVHLKDVRASVQEEVRLNKLSFLHGVLKGFFTIPGDGDIGLDTYKDIFHTLAEANYSGWLVLEAEQDPDKANPLEYAKQGRTFINTYAGV